MNTMRDRAGFRRVDSSWPQTEVMPRRAERTRDNPYRKRVRDTRESGKHATDWIVLAIFVGACVWLWWPALRLVLPGWLL